MTIGDEHHHVVHFRGRLWRNQVERIGDQLVEPLRIHPHGHPATAPVRAAAAVRPGQVAAAVPAAPRAAVAGPQEPARGEPARGGPARGPAGAARAGLPAGAGGPAVGWTIRSIRTTRRSPTNRTSSTTRSIRS